MDQAGSSQTNIQSLVQEVASSDDESIFQQWYIAACFHVKITVIAIACSCLGGKADKK